jgi:hypothetical protein
MTKFGDIDRQKVNAEAAARIKAVLMLLFQMFSGSRDNTSRMIQNFIPFLKRTDNDCGSLPFYGKAYVSHKTNKEHILLTKISMIVQDYWKLASDKLELSDVEATEFWRELKLLEAIAKGSFDSYQVYGKFPRFTLLNKVQIDQLEVAGAKAERDGANRREDAEKAKKLMDSESSDSEDSPSTTEAAETELGKQSESQSEDVESSHDSDDDTKKESTDSSSETDAAKNGVTQQEGSSEASSSDQQVASDSDDQLSVEEADKCGGDCDTCETHACDDGPEREDNLEGATVSGALATETETERVAQQDADGEQYPDVEPLEQTAKEATPPPPMPEEEKDSQAAVDHETGNDQADD